MLKPRQYLTPDMWEAFVQASVLELRGLPQKSAVLPVWGDGHLFGDGSRWG